MKKVIKPTSESEFLQLSNTDYKKIGKGAIIAILGALLTYGSDIILNINFGTYTPIAVAVWSILVNAGWKWIQNNKNK